jgi:hypothetical protein
VQLRWQRLARDLGREDGPAAEVVPFDELPRRLPFYDSARVTPQEWRARIAARQVALAERMIG